MNKRIENLVKRIEKNDGKRVTLRRDILVKMAEEQLFDYMDSYSYDEMFGVSEGKGIKGDFTKSCEDVRTSSVGFCYVSLVDNKLKFDCHVHSNRFFDLYIELNEDQKESKQIEILEDVRIELNEDKNGVEIYFSNKPSEEVRNNLKSNGFRWSKFNKCWYAKQSETTLNFANSLLPKEDEINDLSESEVAATQKNNNTMEVENMNKRDIKINIEDIKEYFETLEFLIQKHAADELDVDGSEIRLFKDNKFIQTSDINTKRILKNDELTLLYQYIINNTDIKINILTNNFNMDSIKEIQREKTKENNIDKLINNIKESMEINDHIIKYENEYIKVVHNDGYSTNFNLFNYNLPTELTVAQKSMIEKGIDQYLYSFNYDNLKTLKNEIEAIYNISVERLNYKTLDINYKNDKVKIVYLHDVENKEIYSLYYIPEVGEVVQYKEKTKDCILSILSHILEVYTPEKDNKINISSPENDKINMNLQLLASKKESYLNNIKQLENIVNDLNNTLENLYNMDCVYTNDKYTNMTKYINEYIKDNDISDTFLFSMNDIIDNITNQIEDIKDVITSDIQQLYKSELDNHKKEYGKLEVIQSKKENKEDLINKDNNNINLIELSALLAQRKAIKNNCDKIYKILESSDIKNGCLSETYFQLNNLNEDIKSNKKLKRIN